MHFWIPGQGWWTDYTNIFILTEHGTKFLQQLYTNELFLTLNSKDQIAQANQQPDLALVSVTLMEVKLPHI